MSQIDQVRDFLNMVGRPIRTAPTIDVDHQEIELIRAKLLEEVDEFLVGIEERDIVKVADGIADVVYVALGAALQLGIDFDRVFTAIHEANMSKSNLDGSVRLGKDGAVLRGDRYVPPAIREALDLHPDE